MAIPEITSADDPLDVALLNRLIAAVHRRALATSRYELLPGVPGPSTGAGLTATPPTVTPLVADTTNGPAPLFAIDIASSGRWKYYNVCEMQRWLYDVIPVYVNDALYPDGPAGFDIRPLGLGLPPRYLLLREDVATSLGYYYPPAFSAGHNPPGMAPWFFRRKVPRRIGSLTQTDSGLEWSGVGLPPPAPFVAGNLAQWYDFPSGFASAYYGGRYRGVYRYTGTAWVAAPEGSAADVLTSDATAGSNTWTPAGFFREGDYYGWWLLEDIRKVCGLLKRTYNEIDIRSAAGNVGYSDLYSGGGLEYSPSVADAWTRAEGIMAASHEEFLGRSGTSAYWYEIPPPSPSAGAAQASALRSTWTWVDQTYNGMARTCRFFVVLFEQLGAGYQWWDGNTGYPNGLWALAGTATHAAVDHTYPYLDGPAFAPSIPPWPASRAVPPAPARGASVYFDESDWVDTLWTFDD